ncbi:MAG: hypothetical protein ABH830_03435 [Patescibacteria group bacterium]
MKAMFKKAIVWLDYQTLLAASWRLAVIVFDWRAWLLRAPWGKPVVDAVYIPNLRDEDKPRYLGKWEPAEGHAGGLRLWLKGTSAHTRAISTTTSELRTARGREKAKEQFISACSWAQKNGAKVVLLAAGTKHLFGDGKKLRKLFPKLVFTIGDNGTFLILLAETLSGLRKAGLSKHARIAILGPHGILGESMVKALLGSGYSNLVGVDDRFRVVEKIKKKYGIEICTSFTELGKVDAVVACTHRDEARLTFEKLNLIKKPSKKIFVTDVAEPSNLSPREYRRCKGIVIRQDAGNAYSPSLRYVLGYVSSSLFGLDKRVTFGCFAESLSIAGALNRGQVILAELDWFSVNSSNMKVIAELFKRDGFTYPKPKCFGKYVRSFDLNLKLARPKFSWVLDFGRAIGLL